MCNKKGAAIPVKKAFSGPRMTQKEPLQPAKWQGIAYQSPGKKYKIRAFPSGGKRPGGAAREFKAILEPGSIVGKLSENRESTAHRRGRQGI
jgi:hypothetical protein